MDRTTADNSKAICNKGFSDNSSIQPRSNFGVYVQVSSPQTLTAYSRKPLCLIVKGSQPHKWHIWFLPTLSPTLKNQKSHFFANAPTEKRI
jgi:hypothetical protein